MPTIADLLGGVRKIDPSWTLETDCEYRLSLEDGQGRVRYLYLSGAKPPRVTAEWLDPSPIPYGEKCFRDGQDCPYLRRADGSLRCAFLDADLHCDDWKDCGRNVPAFTDDPEEV